MPIGTIEETEDEVIWLNGTAYARFIKGDGEIMLDGWFSPEELDEIVAMLKSFQEEEEEF